MSTPGPSGRNGRNGFIGVILDRLLRYADKPWRAIFILVLIIVGGVGFAVYEERGAIIRSWYGPSEPKLKSNLDGVVGSLFWGTDSDAVSIWSVNLNQGLARLVVGKYRSGEEWNIGPPVVPLITSMTKPERLIKLLSGIAFCAETSTMVSPAAKSVREDGFIWVCVVPMPPSASEPIIGTVVLGWKSDVEESHRETAVKAAQAETPNIIQR